MPIGINRGTARLARGASCRASPRATPTLSPLKGLHLLCKYVYNISTRQQKQKQETRSIHSSIRGSGGAGVFPWAPCELRSAARRHAALSMPVGATGGGAGGEGGNRRGEQHSGILMLTTDPTICDAGWAELPQTRWKRAHPPVLRSWPHKGFAPWQSGRLEFEREKMQEGQCAAGGT